jgi:hypothetical protein
MQSNIASNAARQLNKSSRLVPSRITSGDINVLPVAIIAISPNVPSGFACFQYEYASEEYHLVEFGRVIVPNTPTIIEFLHRVGLPSLNRCCLLVLGDITSERSLTLTGTSHQILHTRGRWITCAEVLTRSEHTQHNVLISLLSAFDVNSHSGCSSEKVGRTPMHVVYVKSIFEGMETTPEEADALCVGLAQIEELGAGYSQKRSSNRGHKFFSSVID